MRRIGNRKSPERSGRIFLFADIDDNLITSARQEPEPNATPVAWDNHGSVCGFLTAKQGLLLDWLTDGVELVPTTARSTDAFKRFRMPIPRRYSITAFGGTIHGASGKPLSSWHSLMRDGLVSALPVLASLKETVALEAGATDIDVRINVVADYGIELFLSVKHNRRNLDELAHLAGLVRSHAPQDWTVHLNGNFLAAYPPYLGKEKAAAWFIERFVPEGAVTIGMGDSLTDVPFMELCDYAMVPTKSQNMTAFLNAIR